MQKRTCAKCGTEVFDQLPGGLCPTCLMSAARQSLENRATQARQPKPGIGFELPAIGEVSAAFPELEILEFVGRGGMGAVYKARQKNLDRTVALKVFLYRPDDPEFAARFEREAKALGRLNHPNVVTVHDFGSRSGFHFLTMEFVEGLNLRQLTAEEKLSPEMALQLVPQLCDALQYAHDKGVIHRDIKPENLLIDTEGRVKIADFGLAKMTSNVNGTLTHTQQVMGTLNYMAPEQRERPTEVDHRADIYSLGVVIYELLTGELPLGRFQPPSNKSNVAAELDEVVMRALEKEPDRRYQKISEFKTGFETVGYTPEMAPAPPVKVADPMNAPRGTRCLITLMSGRDKKGEWTPGDPQLVFTMMGGSCLDLSQVKVKSVDITAFTLMGGTEIIVPRGAQVDCDGLILMGATENNVSMPASPDGMKVRIRSWGAMGGCEVRSQSAKEQRGHQAMQRVLEGNPIPSHPVGRFFAYLYYLFALSVTLSIPAWFIASNMGLFGLTGKECRFWGMMSAMAAGLIWTCYHHFRVIVSAGPDSDEDPEEAREHYSRSRVGAFISCIGLAFIFACPTLFIMRSFDVGSDSVMKFFAIVAAIVGGVILVSASQYDEMVLSQQLDKKPE